MENMIEIKDLNFSYEQDSELLRNINFNVPKGNITVILGLSGCGKSTLIRLVDGMIKFQDGEIIVNDKNIKQLSHKELVYYKRHDVSVVFQNYGLLPHLSVIDNVILGLKIRRYTTKEAYEICEPYLELVGLSDWKDASIYSLSGGMKQRVGIARALANKSPVLLMDEPFGALDPITRNELRQELLRIREKLGITVLLVTHDLSEAIQLGDQIIVMKSGEIVQSGTPHEIFDNPCDEYVKKFVESSKVNFNEHK